MELMQYNTFLETKQEILVRQDIHLERQSI